MHKGKQVLTVTKWEFMTFFKWKQEVISKLIMLSIGLVVYFWHNFDSLTQNQYQIAVSGPATLSQPLVDNINAQQAKFVLFTTAESGATLLTKLEQNEQFDAVLELAPITSNQAASVNFYTRGKLDWQQELTELVSEHYRAVYMNQAGISDEKLALINAPVMFSKHYLEDQIRNEHRKSSATAMGVLLLLAAGLFLSFAQIFVSITAEKQQRVTEQLYSCMDATTWIDGKILGQVLLALKALASTLLSLVLGIAFMQVVILAKPLDLSFIDWQLLPWFIAFALAGLYMATAFMAAVAAAIDDPNHSGKSSFMMIPLVPIVIVFLLVDSPSGMAMTFLSYFPLTAFAAMPVKMSLVELPVWQPILSLVISVACSIYIRSMAARLFKMGMVMYGKEPSLAQMAKWAVGKTN